MLFYDFSYILAKILSAIMGLYLFLRCWRKVCTWSLELPTEALACVAALAASAKFTTSCGLQTSGSFLAG